MFRLEVILITTKKVLYYVYLRIKKNVFDEFGIECS